MFCYYDLQALVLVLTFGHIYMHVIFRDNNATICEFIEDEEDSPDSEPEDTDNINVDVVGLSTLEDIHAVDDFLLNNNPFLVFQQQLFDLANTSIPANCNMPGCHLPVSITQETVGSAVYLKWVGV